MTSIFEIFKSRNLPCIHYVAPREDYNSILTIVFTRYKISFAMRYTSQSIPINHDDLPLCVCTICTICTISFLSVD